MKVLVAFQHLLLLICSILTILVDGVVVVSHSDFLFVGHMAQFVGSQFSNQGSNPRPLQWKPRLLLSSTFQLQTLFHGKGLPQRSGDFWFGAHDYE